MCVEERAVSEFVEVKNSEIINFYSKNKKKFSPIIFGLDVGFDNNIGFGEDQFEDNDKNGSQMLYTKKLRDRIFRTNQVKLNEIPNFFRNISSNVITDENWRQWKDDPQFLKSTNFVCKDCFLEISSKFYDFDRTLSSTSYLNKTPKNLKNLKFNSKNATSLAKNRLKCLGYFSSKNSKFSTQKLELINSIKTKNRQPSWRIQHNIVDKPIKDPNTQKKSTKKVQFFKQTSSTYLKSSKKRLKSLHKVQTGTTCDFSYPQTQPLTSTNKLIRERSKIKIGRLSKSKKSFSFKKKFSKKNFDRRVFSFSERLQSKSGTNYLQDVHSGSLFLKNKQQKKKNQKYKLLSLGKEKSNNKEVSSISVFEEFLAS